MSASRQMDVIGLHETSSYGGHRLEEHMKMVTQQSGKIGDHILSTNSIILGSTSLSYRDWALSTIASLTALGDCSGELRIHVEAALKQGVEVEEILDLFHHAQGIVGNPRATSALRAVWPILSEVREATLPKTYTESLVRLADHDTMVRDTHGSGVPIVLIHALSVDSRMFKLIMPSLAQSTGARVIAYDMRGHGHARGAPLTQSLEHLCGDLETLLDTLAIEKIDVYGCSFGGAIAQYFALDYPRRVRSLVPVASSGTAQPVLLSRATRAEEDGVVSLLPETIIRWFHPESIAANTWCVRYARHCIERARTEEWAAAWRAMSKLDTLPRLSELKIPVMALSGTDDASFRPAAMQAILDACTNSPYVEFAEVSKGTHMMAMEQPQDHDVVEKMIAFRKKVDSMSD